MFVGSIGGSSALAIAERAISFADSESRKAKARFVMHAEGGRIHVKRLNDARYINPKGWVATFNKKSDPDWLADEIKGVCNVR